MPTTLSTIQAAISIHNYHSWASASRHSSIRSLSPVLEHSDTGLGPLILVQDLLWRQHFCWFWYRTDWMLDCLAFRHLKKEIHKSYTSTRQAKECWQWKGIQPACPYCWRWKGETPCMSILLALEEDTPCTSILLAVERDTTCMSTLLAFKGETPCTSILLAVERDAPCTSTLLALEGESPTCPYCWQWKGRQPACPYCWRWKVRHPARP